MKEIAGRVWREPAAAIGLLTTLALLVLALATSSDLDADALISIAAPFLSSLGIRQLVTPAAPTPEATPDG
jgi:hypothetical protein